MLKLMSVVVLTLATSLSAQAYTCVATCQGPDGDGEQISSNSFATKREARADLANYCPVNYIENVRCFSRGNPSGGAPLSFEGHENGNVSVSDGSDSGGIFLENAMNIACKQDEAAITKLCDQNGGTVSTIDAKNNNGVTLYCCRY